MRRPRRHLPEVQCRDWLEDARLLHYFQLNLASARSPGKLASCFPAVRIRYNYQFIPGIIPSVVTVKEPFPFEPFLWESEMESERTENRNVVEQRIKRPGKREDRSCPRIQELSILSWSHFASSEFWFISYIIWPWSKNNLLCKAKTSEKLWIYPSPPDFPHLLEKAVLFH